MNQIPFGWGKSPQKRGNIWEKNVSRGLSLYLNLTQKGGDVIHLQKQIIHGIISRPQKIDILVDNAVGHYFGVECKSSSCSSLSLAAWFRHNGEAGQFFKETQFLKNANRIGFVALVMLEAGSDEYFPRYGAYFIPWNVVSRIGTRKITTTVLDKFAKKRLVYKLPTENGTVWLPPETDIFRTLAKMEKKAENLPEDFFAKYFVRKAQTRTPRKKNPLTLPACRSKKKCLAPENQEPVCGVTQRPPQAE